MTCRGAVRCGAVRCDVVRCGAVRCGAVRCGAVWCGVVWCGVKPGIASDARIVQCGMSLTFKAARATTMTDITTTIMLDCQHCLTQCNHDHQHYHHQQHWQQQQQIWCGEVTL